jgi:Mg2+-importing ATPase
VLPFTPIGAYFGFVAPPAQFYFILAAMVVVYLVVVEVAKMAFYRWHRKSSLRKHPMKFTPDVGSVL